MAPRRAPEWLGLSSSVLAGMLFMAGCEQSSPSHAVMELVKPADTEGGTPASGPLRIHPANSRYFTDGSGKAIYLAGSHHWSNLVDGGEIGKPFTPFDYARYLEVLISYRHNFMRMWAWEGAGALGRRHDPLPYLRTGPGTALDGRPKFDLDRFNPVYFDRLRSRVAAAGDRGIYVGIMLFQGWSIYDHGYGNPWPFHPFHPANNVNGINGDPDDDGEGREMHTLQVPSVNARQRAYVRKVIDTVNDLDNVLYEITNETAIFSKDWQYDMIRFVHDYERTKPKQHLVGMTSFHASPADASRQGALAELWGSPADWISPCNDSTADYAADPPSSTGAKAVLNDTDHVFGIGGDHNWVWKTFTRGLHPIYMDPLDMLTGGRQDPAGAGMARKAMGDTRSFAGKMNLAAMAPRADLCSTTYCLADPGSEYLIYLPYGSHWLEGASKRLPRRLARRIKSSDWFHRTVSVDLSGVTQALDVEWFNPVTSQTVVGGSIAGGKTQKLVAPFSGDAVLYIAAR